MAPGSVEFSLTSVNRPGASYTLNEKMIMNTGGRDT